MERGCGMRDRATIIQRFSKNASSWAICECNESPGILGNHRGTVGGIILQQQAASWNSLGSHDKDERSNDGWASGREPVGNPMPRTEVDEHYAELTRKVDALEAELANSQAREHVADVRRRIETLYETLRENRQLLETILENSAANIYAKRRDGRYIYLNHEMEVSHDVTREHALGKTDFELFPREMAEQNRTNDLAAMMTGKLTEVEERVMGPSGERLFLAKKVPLISSDGKVEGMCGISTDITDLRRTELALREAVMSLEGERDNKLMNIEAVTASIAHEVRQPLAAIAMNGEAALQFLEGVPLDIDEVRV